MARKKSYYKREKIHDTWMDIMILEQCGHVEDKESMKEAIKNYINKIPYSEFGWDKRK